jgi:hypothetical protein
MDSKEHHGEVLSNFLTKMIPDFREFWSSETTPNIDELRRL